MRKKRDRKKKNNFLSGEKVKSDKQPKINRKIRNINKSNKKDWVFYNNFSKNGMVKATSIRLNKNNSNKRRHSNSNKSVRRWLPIKRKFTNLWIFKNLLNMRNGSMPREMNLINSNRQLLMKNCIKYSKRMLNYPKDGKDMGISWQNKKGKIWNTRKKILLRGRKK